MQYRYALITGATSGIGRALAEALPVTTHLLLTGRNRERLAELAGRLASDGRQVETVVADLATDAGRAAVIDRAEALEIDFLVNNAGLGRFGAIADNPMVAELEMAAVNVTAVVELTRALLPGMTARARQTGTRAGVMIVASVVAFQAVPYMTTYAASKVFDLFYAEGLAAELRDEPVDVLALCPGGTRTEFFDRAAMPDRTMPYMLSAESVARQALAAMGRRTVLVTDPVRRVTIVPGLLRRRVLRSLVARVMRRLAHRA
ncbi:MAG: SDR family NAD(P)-dependent oxidoreductase [Alphaproteobacteria bacterium]